LSQKLLKAQKAPPGHAPFGPKPNRLTTSLSDGQFSKARGGLKEQGEAFSEGKMNLSFKQNEDELRQPVGNFSGDQSITQSASQSVSQSVSCPPEGDAISRRGTSVSASSPLHKEEEEEEAEAERAEEKR